MAISCEFEALLREDDWITIKFPCIKEIRTTAEIAEGLAVALLQLAEDVQIRRSIAKFEESLIYELESDVSFSGGFPINTCGEAF